MEERSRREIVSPFFGITVDMIFYEGLLLELRKLAHFVDTHNSSLQGEVWRQMEMLSGVKSEKKIKFSAIVQNWVQNGNKLDTLAIELLYFCISVTFLQRKELLGEEMQVQKKSGERGQEVMYEEQLRSVFASLNRLSGSHSLTGLLSPSPLFPPVLDEPKLAQKEFYSNAEQLFLVDISHHHKKVFFLSSFTLFFLFCS